MRTTMSLSAMLTSALDHAVAASRLSPDADPFFVPNTATTAAEPDDDDDPTHLAFDDERALQARDDAAIAAAAGNLVATAFERIAAGVVAQPAAPAPAAAQPTAFVPRRGRGGRRGGFRRRFRSGATDVAYRDVDRVTIEGHPSDATLVAIWFPNRPSADVRASMKSAGWRFNTKGDGGWTHSNTPANWTFAAEIRRRVQG